MVNQVMYVPAERVAVDKSLKPKYKFALVYCGLHSMLFML